MQYYKKNYNIGLLKEIIVKMNKSASITESKSQERKQIESIIEFMSELNTTTLKDQNYCTS